MEYRIPNEDLLPADVSLAPAGFYVRLGPRSRPPRSFGLRFFYGKGGGGVGGVTEMPAACSPFFRAVFIYLLSFLGD